jgi:hypothetical protein
VPDADVSSLDLSSTAALLAAYTASKSAEARAHAAALSENIGRRNALGAWAAAVRSTCKPIEALGLLGKGVASTSSDEGGCASVAASALLAAVSGVASPSHASASPSRHAQPSLREYLRERSSQRASAAALAAASAARSPGVIGSPVPLNPFSPGVPSRGRLSKSPVLVLQRDGRREITVIGDADANSMHVGGGGRTATGGGGALGKGGLDKAAFAARLGAASDATTPQRTRPGPSTAAALGDENACGGL